MFGRGASSSFKRYKKMVQQPTLTFYTYNYTLYSEHYNELNSVQVCLHKLSMHCDLYFEYIEKSIPTSLSV